MHIDPVVGVCCISGQTESWPPVLFKFDMGRCRFASYGGGLEGGQSESWPPELHNPTWVGRLLSFPHPSLGA